MKTGTIIFIIFLAVLVAYYFLIYAPAQKLKNSGTTNGSTFLNPTTPLSVGGIGIPNSANPSLIPVKVSRSQITVMNSDVSTFFNSLTANTIASYNVLTKKLSNPARIYFTIGYTEQCSAFVWHKNWLYSLVPNFAGRTSPGEQTCNYTVVNPSLLPEELRIDSTGNNCPGYKLYISGTEYTYSSTETVPTFSSEVKFCVYKKSV